MNSKANAVFWIGFILIIAVFWLSGQSSQLWRGITQGTSTGGLVPPSTTGGNQSIPLPLPGYPFVPPITVPLSSQSGTGTKKKKGTGSPYQLLSANVPAGGGPIPPGSGRTNLPIASITQNGQTYTPSPTSKIGNVFKLPSGTGLQLYAALRDQGLSPVATTGIMGNIMNETSTTNLPYAVENQTGDSGTSWGLVQWHIPFHPEARGLVTGNYPVDFANQVKQIANVYKTYGISGSTPGQVAGNWASQFENCVGCQPGQSQWQGRVANAGAIFRQSLLQGWEAKYQASKIKPAPPQQPNLSIGHRNMNPSSQPMIPTTSGSFTNNFPGGYANWINGGWEKFARALGLGVKASKSKAKVTHPTHPHQTGAISAHLISFYRPMTAHHPAPRPKAPTTHGHGPGHPLQH